MLKIIIGEPVQQERRFDVYELAVENMSGDADAYDTNTLYFQNTEKDLLNLEQYIVLLEGYGDIASGYHNDDGACDEVFATMKEKFGISEDHCSDMLSDTVGYDVTYEGYRASLEGWSLFYWDKNGNKHEATAEIL